eukprot:Em0001g3008a
MECSVDDIYIYTIAEYDFDWVRVGRRLLSDPKVRNIDNEQGSEDDKRNTMLLEWKKTKTHDATYQALVNVLQAIENNATADRVELEKCKSQASTFNQSTTDVPLGVVKYAEYLKGVYKVKPCGEQWLSLVSNCYINLSANASIEDFPKKKVICILLMIHSKIEEIKKLKSSITTDQEQYLGLFHPVKRLFAQVLYISDNEDQHSDGSTKNYRMSENGSDTRCATGSVLLSPQGNYTVFQSNASAVFNCSGDGYVVSWVLNGSSYNQEHRQRGIIVALNPPSGTTTSSSLLVPSSPANNNTEVICRVIDSTFSNVQTSNTSSITIQGPLVAPYDFSVAMSNTSNATLILSWGAPFSLDVTDSPDIFYYTLCTNITIYGCRTIPSDPDCSFPRKCTFVSGITNSSLISADEGQNKVNLDYGDHIQFTFFAVNGAGNGDVANFVFFNILPGKSG